MHLMKRQFTFLSTHTVIYRLDFLQGPLPKSTKPIHFEHGLINYQKWN